MNTDTQKLIKEHFDELPKMIQDVILNSNWEEKIRRIVKNNNLHIDQGAAIESLVFVTMLGMEVPEDFVQNAREYAKVSEEQAFTIASEVERTIFHEIREKLIHITETADTVGEIGRVTDELSKVAEDIEERSKQEVDDREKEREEEEEVGEERESGGERWKAEEREEGYTNIKIKTKKPLSEHLPKNSFTAEDRDPEIYPEFNSGQDSGRRSLQATAEQVDSGSKTISLVKDEKETLPIEVEKKSISENKSDLPTKLLTEKEIIQKPENKPAQIFKPVPPMIPIIIKESADISKEKEKESDIILEKLGSPVGAKKESSYVFDEDVQQNLDQVDKKSPLIEVRDHKGHYKVSDPYREDIE